MPDSSEPQRMGRAYVLIRIYIGENAKRSWGSIVTSWKQNAPACQWMKAKQESPHRPVWDVKPTGVENQGAYHMSIMGQEDPVEISQQYCDNTWWHDY